MAETFPCGVEFAGGMPSDPAMHRPDVARWELDTSRVRPLMAAGPDGGYTDPDRVEAVLASALVAGVNREVVFRVGAYFGHSEMLGEPIGTFWPAEGRADLAELILEVQADGSPGASRKRVIPSLLLRDPELTVWRTEAHGPNRMFVEVEGALRDERSHWALRASEERYRKLIHHLPFALVQVDAREVGEVFAALRARGVRDIVAYLDAHPELIEFAKQSVRITEVNHGVEQLFRADSAADLLGPVVPLFAASPETARRVMIAHFEGRRSHVEMMKLRTLDGRLLDVRLSVTYPTPPEQLDVTLISLEDVTGRLRTEAQLRQIQADFTRAARISTLGELTTSIAHEVNQPLAAILTNAETSLRWLGRDDPNLEKIGQLTSRIAASARRASEIVQRIRGMAARREPERVPIDLNEVVYEALLFVRHDLEARSIDLSLELGTRLPRILGDRVQLQQVIVNLLVNSIQAIAQDGVSNGRIDIATMAEADGAALSIRDCGPGIAAEHLERVFDGFFTTKEDGMGIGLALCQSIVAAHGGRIVASNHPGGGALFRFALPAAVPA